MILVSVGRFVDRMFGLFRPRLVEFKDTGYHTSDCYLVAPPPPPCNPLRWEQACKQLVTVVVVEKFSRDLVTCYLEQVDYSNQQLVMRPAHLDDVGHGQIIARVNMNDLFTVALDKCDLVSIRFAVRLIF